MQINYSTLIVPLSKIDISILVSPTYSTLQWVGDNWQAIGTLFFSLVVAFYAHRANRLNGLLVRQQIDPSISIHLSPHTNAFRYFDITIQNVGNGAAKNINFSLSLSRIQSAEIAKLSELTMLKNGLPYLAQQQSITVALGTYASLRDVPFHIHVTYESAADTAGANRFEESFPIDVKIFDGMHQIGTPVEAKIATSLESISKDVKSIRTGDLNSRMKFTVTRQYFFSRMLNQWRTYWFGEDVIYSEDSSLKHLRWRIGQLLQLRK